MKRFKQILMVMLICSMVLSSGGFLDLIAMGGMAYGASADAPSDIDTEEGGDADVANVRAAADDADKGEEAGDASGDAQGASESGEEANGGSGSTDSEEAPAPESAVDAEAIESGEPVEIEDGEVKIIEDADDGLEYQEIRVTPEQAPLYKKGSKEKNASKEVKAVRRFWKALTERKAENKDNDKTGKKAPVKLVVSGNLPEGATAEASYIEFGEEDIYNEQILTAFDITIRDKAGNPYIPDDSVTVKVSGRSVKSAVKKEAALQLYSYAVNDKRSEKYSKKYDKNIYAADVLVFRDRFDDDKRLEYKPYDKKKKYKDGEDAVRYYEDETGLVYTEDGKSVLFDYIYGNITGKQKAKDETDATLHFVLSQQLPEDVLKKNIEAKEKEKADAEKKAEENAAADAEKQSGETADKSDEQAAEPASDTEKEKTEAAEASDKAESEGSDGINKEEPAVSSDAVKSADGEAGKTDAEKGKGDKGGKDKEDSEKPETAEGAEEPAGTVKAAEAETKQVERIATDGRTYRISAVYETGRGIPENAILEVKEIRSGELGYKSFVKRSTEESGKNPEDLAFVKAFDITFKDPVTGMEYQPDESVSVSIQLLRNDISGAGSVDVVHFGDKVEVMDSEVKDGAIEFEAEGFSVYVVCAYTVETYYRDSEGKDWKITAKFGPDTGLPEDVELKVRELDSKESKKYHDGTAKALGKAKKEVSIAKAFDISFVKDGKTYHKLDGDVEISIELMEDELSGGMEVVHFSTDGQKTGDPAQYKDGEKIDSTAEGSTVSFASDEFSVYIIGQTELMQHYVFYNGSDVFSEQVLITGESLVMPPMPSKDGAVFDHWSTDPNAKPNTDSYTDTNTFNPANYQNITIDKTKTQEQLDAAPVNFYAIYQAAKTTITYYNQSGLVVEKRDVAKPAEGEAPISVDTKEVNYIPIQDKDNVTVFFEYWTENALGQGAECGTNGTLSITNNSNDKIDLYPVLHEGHYIYFDGNKSFYKLSSVDYTAPQKVVDSEGTSEAAKKAKAQAVATALNEKSNKAIPTTTGYTFKGWYLRSSDAGDDDSIEPGNYTGDLAKEPIFYPDGGEIKVNEAAYIKLLDHTGNLPNNPTLYAHWEANAKTSYSIIVWKQNVNDPTSYDYVESVTVPDVDTGTTPGTYYLKEYAAEPENGFKEARKVPTDEAVKSDGSTVMNIYYDRQTVTINYFTFQYQQNNNGLIGYQNGAYVRLGKRNNYNNYTYWSYNNVPYSGTFYIAQGGNAVEVTGELTYNSTSYYGVIDGYYRQLTPKAYNGNRYSGSWSVYNTLTGLYGQTFEQNGVSWPTEYDWYSNGDSYGGTGGSRTTFLQGFLPTDEGQYTLNFYGSSPNGSLEVRWHKQDIGADGDLVNTYTKANSVLTSGGNFNITDKYNGFTAYQYSVDEGVRQNVGVKNPSTGVYGEQVSYDNSLDIYYKRNTNSIVFRMNDEGNTVHKTVRNVPYESPLSKWKPEDPERNGYLFAGWYYDSGDNQTVPVDFAAATSTMPDSNLVLYAKWTKVKNRAILIPNGGNMEGVGGTMFHLDLDKGEKIDLSAEPTRDFIKVSNGTGSHTYDPTTGIYTDTGSNRGDYNERLGAYVFQGWYQATLTNPGDVKTIQYGVDSKTGAPKYTYAYGDYQQVEAGKGAYNLDSDTGTYTYVGTGGSYNFVNAEPKLSHGDYTVSRDKYDLSVAPREPVTLVAMWQRAGGFHVEYNTVDPALNNAAVEAPEDTEEYIDGAHARVLPALGAPKGYALEYWAGPVTDEHPDGKYLPNELVHVTDSHAVLDENGKDMTVKLTAHYRKFEPTERLMADYKFMVDKNEDGNFVSEEDLYELQRIAVNEELKAPITPSRDGYIFKGWYYDSEGTRKFDGFGVITNPTYTTLYAVFEKAYTVTYYLTDSSTKQPTNTILATQTYSAEGEPQRLDTRKVVHPVDTDHYVKMWYSDKNNLDNPVDLDKQYPYRALSSKTVQSNMKLYAVLGERNYVQFDSHGGSFVETQEIPDGGWPVRPNEPTRKGYTFDGWYTQPSGGGVPYEFDQPLDNLSGTGAGKDPEFDPDNAVLHAQWELSTQQTNAKFYVVWWAQTGDRPEDDTEAAQDKSHYQMVANQQINGTTGQWTANQVATKMNTDAHVDMWDLSSVATYAVQTQHQDSAIAFTRSTLEIADGQTITNANLQELNKYFEKNQTKSDASITVDDSGTTVMNVYFDLKKYTLEFYDRYNKSMDINTGYYIQVKIHANGRSYTGTQYSFPVWLGKDISKQWPIESTVRSTATNDSEGAWVEVLYGTGTDSKDGVRFDGWMERNATKEKNAPSTLYRHKTLLKTVSKDTIDLAFDNGGVYTVRPMGDIRLKGQATLHYMEWVDGHYVEMEEHREDKYIYNDKTGNDPDFVTPACGTYYLRDRSKDIAHYINVNDENGEPSPARFHNYHYAEGRNLPRVVERTGNQDIEHDVMVYKYSLNPAYSGVTFYGTRSQTFWGTYTYSDPLTITFGAGDNDLNGETATDGTLLNGYTRKSKQQSVTVKYGNTTKTGGNVYYRDTNRQWHTLTWDAFMNNVIITETQTYHYTETVTNADYYDLYFYYEPIKYGIIFMDGNVKINEVSNIPYRQQIAGPGNILDRTVPDESLTPEGMRFAGWATSPGQSDPTKAYNANEGRMPGYNLTLYAIWEPLKYIVTTKGVDYEGNPVADENSATYEFGYNQKLKEKIKVNPKADEKLFTGWKLVDSETIITGNYPITRHITIEPNWNTLETCSVVYNANGGTGTPPDDNNKYMHGAKAVIKDGKGLEIPRTSIDGSSYQGNFAFWNTRSDGCGITYYPNSTYTFKEGGEKNLTLYAIYSQYRETKLIYDKNAEDAVFKQAGPTWQTKNDDYKDLTKNGLNISTGQIEVFFRDKLDTKWDSNKSKIPNEVFPVAQDGENQKFTAVRSDGLGNEYQLAGWAIEPDASLAIAQNGDRAYVNTIRDEQGNLKNTLYAVWGICKVVDKNGKEHAFDTIQKAVNFINTSSLINGKTGTIQMLIDYKKPNSDAPKNSTTGSVSIPSGCNITLTTATTGILRYSGTAPAKITRAENGGSMFTSGGSFTITNIILDGGSELTQAKTCSANGGIVKVNSGTLNVQTGAVLRNSKTSRNGGAVYLADGATMSMTAGTITGNTAADGGAVYLADGATMTMTAGTIRGNTATLGAGIYLEEGSELRLSGSPGFGGTAATGINTIGTGDNAKRQDIYIDGYLGKNDDDPKLAQSLIVTGALDLDQGSIWVGAQVQENEENNHWDVQKQFARFDRSLIEKEMVGDEEKETVNLGEDALNKTLQAFRNATISEEYYGTTGDAVNCIYWDGVKGGRKVILRKVKKDTYSIIQGAEFTVYRENSEDPYVIKHKNGDTVNNEELKNLSSGASGVIWIGNLPYGTYYLKETAAPDDYSSNVNKWFCLIVDAEGTYMSDRGYTVNEPYEKDSNEEDPKKVRKGKDAALANATAVKS